MAGFELHLVEEPDLPELLPLMRGYCAFYDVAPADEELMALSRTLIANPAGDGLQLLARSAEDRRSTSGWARSARSGSTTP